MLLISIRIENAFDAQGGTRCACVRRAPSATQTDSGFLRPVICATTLSNLAVPARRGGQFLDVQRHAHSPAAPIAHTFAASKTPTPERDHENCGDGRGRDRLLFWGRLLAAGEDVSFIARGPAF
jgi:hypothetical protein